MEENNEFESRFLTDVIDVLAVVNHLEDNLGKKTLRFVMTVNPKKVIEADHCSLKCPYLKIILVEDEQQIPKINALLKENLFTAQIHVAITPV
jgi:hypothetical protein